MNIHEYQGKELLRRYGVAVLVGLVAVRAGYENGDAIAALVVAVLVVAAAQSARPSWSRMREAIRPPPSPRLNSTGAEAGAEAEADTARASSA